MIKLIDLIAEAKQVGTLYHYTSEPGAAAILKSNRINASVEEYRGNELYYVSFTRNKDFHKRSERFGVKTAVRIAIDGDRLSDRYKVKPFAYIPGWDYENTWEYDWLNDVPESEARHFLDGTGDYDEAEERIYFPTESSYIGNIKDYILSVDKM